MEELFEWIDERIHNDLVSEEEKLNFQSFGDILRNSDLLINHGGRYLLINHGKVWSETFHSPQDTFADDLSEDYMLFRIPENNHCNKTSNFNTRGDIIIPVKLILNK